MNNSLVVAGNLSKARSDLDEAAHALSNYLETKSDEESVAWLHSAIEATVRAVASVSLAVERLAEIPQSLTWLTAPDGVLYTEPRRFAIDHLPNDLYRLYQYGPGTSDLYETEAEAKQAAGELLNITRSDGAAWADLQSDTEAIDGDQVL